MSVINPSPLVKPFTAIFAADQEWVDRGLAGMGDIWGGQPDWVSPALEIVETTYYRPEMGDKLLKIYASWPELVKPESLVEMKLAAMDWERHHALDGRRLANLDPGYIFCGGLVLSTAKFRGHRLPLGQGIWGELTLNYHHKQFQAFPWTYLDYQSSEVQNWLFKMRQTYICSINLNTLGLSS